MRKLLFVAFGVIGSFLLFAHGAEAATLYSDTQDSETKTFHSPDGQTYMNGYGGGCTTNCEATMNGVITRVVLKLNDNGGFEGDANMAILGNEGVPKGCESVAPVNMAGKVDEDLIAWDFLPTSGDCDILAGDIFGLQISGSEGGSDAGEIVWYGGPDGSTFGKVWQVWHDDVTPPPPDGDGFSFVQFEPSLFGRTLQDWMPYYSVRYSSPAFENELPLWLRVQVSTSSDFSTTVASTSVNVWTYSGIQNLPKDPLSNGAYFSRITLATSTDFVNTLLAQTTGSFSINASSTDGINCTTGGANPGCANNGTSTDENASTTTSAAVTVLNCPQYEFITEYDAVLFTFPFFSVEAPQRVGCEILAVTYKAGEILIVPGKVIDGRGAVTSQLTEFRTVLPFVLYFGTIDAMQQGIDVGASTTPATLGFLYPATYNEGMLNPDTMSTFTVLSSTTLTDFLQNSQYCNESCALGIRDTYFDWMRVAIWVFTGLTAVAVII